MELNIAFPSAAHLMTKAEEAQTENPRIKEQAVEKFLKHYGVTFTERASKGYTTATVRVEHANHAYEQIMILVRDVWTDPACGFRVITHSVVSDARGHADVFVIGFDGPRPQFQPRFLGDRPA